MRAPNQQIDIRGLNKPTWLEQMCERSGLGAARDILGDTCLALSIIHNIRLLQIEVDETNPAYSIIELNQPGESQSMRVYQADFLRQLCSLHLSQSSAMHPGIEERARLLSIGDDESIKSLLGYRYILLSPIFNMHLISVVGDSASQPCISFSQGEMMHAKTSIDAFWQHVDQHIVSVMQDAERIDHLQLSSDTLIEAEEAFERGAYEDVCHLLERWPHIVMHQLHERESESLSEAARAEIMTGMKLLGQSQYKEGESRWAEEIFRLGLQCASPNDDSSTLYMAYAQFLCDEDRHSEAVGYFQRASSKGLRHIDIDEGLHACYAKSGHELVAALCAHRALRKGSQHEFLRAWLEAYEQRAFGWKKLQQKVSC